MSRKKVLLTVIFLTFYVAPLHAIEKIVDCEATKQAWEMSDPNLIGKCSCPNNNQEPVCTPKTSSLPYVGSTKQQIQMQMLQSILQPMFDSVFDFSDLFPTPKQSHQDALRKQQQEEALRKQQEMAKKKAWEDWLRIQAEAEAKRLREDAARKRKADEILATSSISGKLNVESIGGGSLSPFQWDSKKDLHPTTQGQFPSPKSAAEQLLYAAYFSKLASESSDVEGVRFYNTQMENVMQGLPTSIACKPPKELMTGIDVRRAGELNRRYTEIAKIIQEVTPKIEKLQDVVVKIEEVKVKKQESEKRIKEIDLKIEEIKTKAQFAETPQKKAEADDLLAQALALKSDAEKQHQEAVQLEEKLNKEKESIENEINEVKHKKQTGGLR